jgi:hypothetical protein
MDEGGLGLDREDLWASGAREKRGCGFDFYRERGRQFQKKKRGG